MSPTPNTDAVSVGRRVLHTEAEALTLMAEALGEPFAQAVDLFAGLSGRIVDPRTSP